ncbi:MAG: phage tail assembly protein [Burkholderiaceae bacterium]|jgi:hypothetical protein|nr:phage tail assembly protein [Burkholderiaceae bacterium]
MNKENAIHTVVTLEYPLKTPTGEVRQISFRRGKAKDVARAQRMEPNDPARRELALMSILTQERLTLEDMEELDLADLAEVQMAFQGLFIRPGRKDAVADEGVAGAVVPVSAIGN